MTGMHEHNSNLPLPQDVLLVEPRNLLFDGVKSIKLGHANGFWLPKDERLRGIYKDVDIVSTTFAPEVFNQFAAYVLAHGLSKPKRPILLGADNVSWRRIICLGDVVDVNIDVEAQPNAQTYKADGFLIKGGEVACRGTIFGTLDENEAFYDLQIGEAKQLQHEITTFKETEDDEIVKADLVILDDYAVELDGRHIELSRVGSFILEALINSGDRFVTAKEIYLLPDFPSSTKAYEYSRQSIFSAGKNNLRRQLVVGEPAKPIITQKSDKTQRQYLRLNPGVSISRQK